MTKISNILEAFRKDCQRTDEHAEGGMHLSQKQAEQDIEIMMQNAYDKGYDQGKKTQEILDIEKFNKALPKEWDEGDGWDVHFMQSDTLGPAGKLVKKGKVRQCCPGDDLAYVRNVTIAEARKRFHEA